MTLKKSEIIADKAYGSKIIREKFLHQETTLNTPIKLTKKKKFFTEDERKYSKIVNSVRQPIESFFNWVIAKTGIQNASKVRSEKGLVIHIFGRFVAALLLLVIQGTVEIS